MRVILIDCPGKMSRSRNMKGRAEKFDNVDSLLKRSQTLSCQNEMNAHKCQPNGITWEALNFLQTRIERRIIVTVCLTVNVDCILVLCMHFVYVTKAMICCNNQPGWVFIVCVCLGTGFIFI